MREDIKLGIIILTIFLTGTTMFTWSDVGLKLRVDEYRATFYILESGHYRVKAREYSSLWDFPSKMNRDLSSIVQETTYDLTKNTSTKYRSTTWIRGPRIEETWKVDGNQKDITQFPKEHQVKIYDGQGYVYQYEIRDLVDYDGETKKVTSPLKVGKITIEWDKGAYFAKVYKSGILKVRYKLDEPIETFQFRVYDPPATVNLYFDDGTTNHSAPIDVEYGRTVRVWAVESSGTAPVCLSADNHPTIGHNVSCDTGVTSYLWNVTMGTDQFNDSSIAKNMTFPGTIITTQSDGYVHNYSTVWATTRTDSTGSDHNDANTHIWIASYLSLEFSYYHIYRGFLFFDISSESGNVTSAKLRIYANSGSNNANEIVAFEGTQTDPIVNDDFDAFTGSEFGRTDDLDGTTGDDDWHEIELNASGITYINGLIGSGTAKFCLRSDKDVDDDTTGFNAATYLTQIAAYGSANPPELVLTFSQTNASLFNKSVSITNIRNQSDVNSVEIGIYGYNSNGNYPKNVKIDFNNDTSVHTFHGEVRGSSIQDFDFADGTNNWNKIYTGAAVKTANILVAKDYNVTNATVELVGEQNKYFQFNTETLNTDADGFYYRPYAPNCDIYGTSDYVYCFGGQCTDDFCDDNGGEYNTSVRITRGGGIGSIIPRTTMPYEAGIGSCAIYYNNYYYVIGGYDGSTIQDKVYRYYPAGNNWAVRTSITEPKSFFQCALDEDNGIIYISGGYTTGSVWDISAYAYDISGNSWSPLADPPDGQEQGWAEMYNSTHFVTFGGTKRGSASGGKTYLYDISGNSWSSLDTITEYPYANAGANVDGTLYSYGGYFNPSDSEPWVFFYNATSDTWTRTTDNASTYFFMDDCWEIEGHVECYGSGGFGIGSYWREIYHLPDDVAIQVGDSLTQAYQGSGALYNEGVTATSWQDSINEELVSCTENNEGVCNITLYIGNPGAGNILLQNLNITTSISKVRLTGANLSCDSDYCNPLIRVQSDQQGTLEINSMNISYKGTGNVTWNASSPGDGGGITTNYTVGIATAYYSLIQRTLPYTWTDTIFVLPNSYNTTKWPAYGQDSDTPIVNITGQAQDKDINISIKLNESLACLTWYYNSEDNSTTASNFSNSSYVQIDQISNTGTNSVWMWATLYECNSSVKRYLMPELEWITCCDTCIACP